MGVKNAEKLYAEALYSALEGKKNNEVGAVIASFLNFLKTKAKLHRIQKVVKEFKAVYNQKNGITELKIKSAHPINDKTAEEIAKSLNLKNYELEKVEDKSLIGGFTAQYNDSQIDASIKNNLNNLHNQLIK